MQYAFSTVDKKVINIMLVKLIRHKTDSGKTSC
jgi:hypothetical protein